MLMSRIAMVFNDFSSCRTALRRPLRLESTRLPECIIPFPPLLPTLLPLHYPNHWHIYLHLPHLRYTDDCHQSVCGLFHRGSGEVHPEGREPCGTVCEGGRIPGECGGFDVELRECYYGFWGEG